MITEEMVEAALMGSYTHGGIERWWRRSRHQLDGLTPRQVWDRGDRVAVYNLAISIRDGGMGT